MNERNRHLVASNVEPVDVALCAWRTVGHGHCCRDIIIDTRVMVGGGRLVILTLQKPQFQVYLHMKNPHHGIGL